MSIGREVDTDSAPRLTVRAPLHAVRWRCAEVYVGARRSRSADAAGQVISWVWFRGGGWRWVVCEVVVVVGGGVT